MTKPRDRNFLEAFLQNAEALIDVATENEATRAIPIIGTAFKVAKGIDDLRSRALAARLAAFVQDPSLQSQRAKKLLVEAIATEKIKHDQIGETLFLLLERVTDFTKPSLLAKVFLAYLDGQTSADDLKRLAHAIDLSYIGDLVSLLAIEGTPSSFQHEKLARSLIGTGFSAVTEGTTIDNMTTVDSSFTSLARLFRTAIKHANSLAEQDAG